MHSSSSILTARHGVQSRRDVRLATEDEKLTCSSAPQNVNFAWNVLYIATSSPLKWHYSRLAGKCGVGLESSRTAAVERQKKWKMRGVNSIKLLATRRVTALPSWITRAPRTPLCCEAFNIHSNAKVDDQACLVVKGQRSFYTIGVRDVSLDTRIFRTVSTWNISNRRAVKVSYARDDDNAKVRSYDAGGKEQQD